MAHPVEYYFQRYGDLELQRRMVADRRRTDAFAAALRQVVKPGDVVLDVGTGTGILAMMAAKAGAARVYAIDQADIAEAARRVVAANGLDGVVEIRQGAAAELQLPERVDVLVSEWLGNLAYVEGMLDDVLAARDANLKPGGRMIPGAIEVRLAPIDDPVLYGHDGPGFWREPVHGLDLSVLEDLELAQARAVQIRVEPWALLAEGAVVSAVDLHAAGPADVWSQGTARFTARRDGALNGFVGWFAALLAPGVPLDTGPRHPETHWAQSYFAFPPRAVRAGEILEVRYQLARDPEEHRHVRLQLELDGVAQDYLIE